MSVSRKACSRTGEFPPSASQPSCCSLWQKVTGSPECPEIYTKNDFHSHSPHSCQPILLLCCLFYSHIRYRVHQNMFFFVCVNNISSLTITFCVNVWCCCLDIFLVRCNFFWCTDKSQRYKLPPPRGLCFHLCPLVGWSVSRISQKLLNRFHEPRMGLSPE